MQNIIFEGWYGNKNIGDDAFVEVSAWGANRYWNSHDIIFKGENLPLIKTKTRSIDNLSYRKGHNRINIIKTYLSSKAIVYSGGSIFTSPIQPFNTRHIAMLKNKFGRHSLLGAIGVSLGPYSSLKAENDNLELLKSLSFLTLRDTYSYHLALSYNLPYEPIESFDLAALLPAVYNKYERQLIKSNKILGVCLCNYESYLDNGDLRNEQRRNHNIVRLIKQIAKLNNTLRIRFFIFYGNTINGDFILTNNVINELRSIKNLIVEIVPYDPITFNVWQKVKECSAFISTRLHGAIFACYANIPFLLFEYHRKCKDFLDTIGYINDYRVYDADFDITCKAQLISSFMEFNYLFKLPIYYHDSINKAYRNFTATRMYFDRSFK
jgi:polysaccharide pyruvyl transferase WcaK-like protein